MIHVSRSAPPAAWLRRLPALLAVLLGATLLAAGPTDAQGGEVWVLEVEGVINPVTSRYVTRSIAEAEAAGAAAVLIEIDTPGGLLDSTREITTAMLNADVPLITYVTPRGARAASAGVFITLSGHVAAMAPDSRMGAATPVSAEGGDIPDDLREKIINDTVVYARSLANARGRNADWAEAAVRDAEVIGAEEAVEMEVVDLIAPDRAALLAAIDGETVELRSGARQLETGEWSLVERSPSAIEQLLSVISDPNIALLLLSIGSIGIYLELSAPGSFLPGIAGGIALILGLFGLGTLPINYAGLALLLLGIALMGAEVWVASGGLLGIGGALAFVLGALLLIDDTQAPFLEISRPLLIGITLALVAFVLFAFRAVARTRRRPAFIGGADMVGLVATVRASDSIYVEGERWRARLADADAGPLVPGSRVKVVGRDGFDLVVEPLPDEAAPRTEEE